MLRWLSASSMYSRFLLLLIGGLIASFLVSNYLWVYVFSVQKEEHGREMANDVAVSIGRTMESIRVYPAEYRHLILNQMRDIGGSRFLVSINKEFIHVDPIPKTQASERFLNDFMMAIDARLGTRLAGMEVAFADPTTLSVYRNDIKLIDLPPRWAQNNLIREPDVAPVIVAQLPLGDDEWLYVAGLLPDPYFLSESRVLSVDQILFLAIMMVVLLVVGMFTIKLMTQPLTNLAKAARHLGTDIEYDIKPVLVNGPREVRETAAAFNFMQERILRFLENRERLFSAISHDLKTPITRLRLRAELMEETDIQSKMLKDIEELEAMVKGALEFGRSTEIHEDTVAININQLVRTFKDEFKLMGSELEIRGIAHRLYYGKPLALKRCLSNLINNGIFYGSEVRIDIVDTRTELALYVVDKGPGIPEAEMERVFQPYVRLESSRNRNTGGAGLGLSIARNIAQAHGGQLKLRNRVGFGLEAGLLLPRI